MLSITNTTVTREQVWTAFRRTHDVRLRERYHTILLLMNGKSCSEIAQWLYRDEDTTRTWVRAFNEAGCPGLERADPGAPSVTHGGATDAGQRRGPPLPRESSYHMSLWTTKLVRHFLYTLLGMECCRERVRQLLHALGFRLRRLRHRHLKAKPEEQAAFRTELEKLLAEWPEDWELVFVDEATVRRHPTLTA